MMNILNTKCFIQHLSKITSVTCFPIFRFFPLYSLVLRKNCYDEPIILNKHFRFFSTNLPLQSQNEYKVTFIKANGDRIAAKGKEGDSLLDVIVNNNLDFDGFGACEGTLTCSTCHCIFKQEDYDRLPEKPCDEELDMLDLAYDLTSTSRLGCQIQLSKDLDGIEVRIPATINDARS